MLRSSFTQSTLILTKHISRKKNILIRIAFVLIVAEVFNALTSSELVNIFIDYLVNLNNT
jgi:hypothetical protein